LPQPLRYCDVRDVGKAAKDYHSVYRYPGGGSLEQGWQEFEKTGRGVLQQRSRRHPGKVWRHQRQLFAQSAGPAAGLGLLGSDQRQPRLGILDLAQVRGAFGDDHFQGRAHVGFAQVASHRRPVPPADHEMNVQARPTRG
jgi:hypothetical protein